MARSVPKSSILDFLQNKLLGSNLLRYNLRLFSIQPITGQGNISLVQKMALSTLRLAARPCQALLTSNSLVLRRSMPMATSATDQMKQFWEKNQKLGRPNSPWTIYSFHLPMATSLTHRITGITMGVALYGMAIGLAVGPADFCTYFSFLKSLSLPMELLFPIKTVMAFPLVYHYINGIRHLLWDAGYGFELNTQYKTGYFNLITSFTIASFLAAYTYLPPIL